MVHAIDIDQMHAHLLSKEQLDDLENVGLFQNMDIECSNASSGLDSTRALLSFEEHSPSCSITFKSCQDGSVESLEELSPRKHIKKAFHSNKASDFTSIEAESLIWLPPEPEDMDNIIDNNDDDDDYTDGTKWGLPSFSCNIDEDQGSICSYKEERLKAMMEVMNGLFRILVIRCLASESISFSNDASGENWLDILTSLSWEAALLVKPDASEGRAMDPSSYVKVKCIASGSRSQSQVIQGLVFKKSPAHKHMPTKIQNAKLLLLRGCQGNSANSLSSFESMGKEKNHLKSIVDLIDTCQPNVVLVEKTVSRDIQEALFVRGITLVFDMKLPRLERIALCTGSQIVPLGDNTVRQNLKQCDTFRFEKFVEEQNSFGDTDKRMTKTLMFLEGCPKPLGCTILLKGANSGELKKIKRALHYTVFAAYHLKIETSFFAEQKAFFSYINSLRKTDDISKAEMVNSEKCDDSLDSNFFNHQDCSVCSPTNAVDVPIFYDSMMEFINGDQPNNSYESTHKSWQLFGSSIKSLRDNIMHRNVPINDDILPSVSNESVLISKSVGEIHPSPSESVSSYFELKRNEHGSDCDALRCPLVETFDYKKSDSDFGIGGKDGHFSDATQTTEIPIGENTKEVKLQCKGDIDSALDSESILVLSSSICIAKQVTCEESHLSRIKYYGDFDMSLGRYLQDILLSKNYACSSCGEPSEAHMYRFTHSNGILTAKVKHCSKGSALPGEAEGKIWMWSRCLKCDHDGGGSKASRRVAMSAVARRLSFGKFLDLSFTDHCAAIWLSRCGHLLHRDCLRFFGLGCKVAMFQYSPIEIYTACKPQPFLEFNSQKGQEWMRKEAEDVLAKGEPLFREVANALQNLKPHFTSFRQKKPANFLEAENMFKDDKTAFEESVHQYFQQRRNVNKILDLHWLKKELLFMLYIWDRRLNFLMQHVGGFSCTVGHADQFQKPVFVKESSITDGDHFIGNLEKLENKQEIESTQTYRDRSHVSFNPYIDGENSPKLVSKEHSETATNLNTFNLQNNFHLKKFDEESVAIFVHVQEEDSHEVSIVPLSYSEEGKGNENSIMLRRQYSSDSDDPEQWMWTPLFELLKAFRKDLYCGSLCKFRFINDYTPVYLSRVSELFAQECTLHFTIGSGNDVMSLVDDEISSIIACALALCRERCDPAGAICNIDKKGSLDCATDTSNRLHHSVSLSQFPDSASLEPKRLLSDDLLPVASEAPLSVDQLVASDKLHPEVCLGAEKRCKYSVICIYAKEFYSLRKKCCPSELAYITSLSRCKKWNAQGGKSKVFFAKTMDDRFIIKQIKKTELGSFLKFGPQYFKYLSFSLDSGSQTCLAKILGIYQVKQIRNGKLVKTDLMIMENLLSGRNISRKYDLKGAIFSRYVPISNKSDNVLLDENFIEDMRMFPVYVDQRTKHLLQRAIWNDTSFLNSINVMDYSLLVGVDRERHELVFGIIDYVRQYTWDKQLETWVKSSLVVPKHALPTVVSPKEYKNRFRKFMSKYLMTVPDIWSSKLYSALGNFLLSGSNFSSLSHDENVEDRTNDAYARYSRELAG